jgi:hypothetical protein
MAGVVAAILSAVTVVELTAILAVLLVGKHSEIASRQRESEAEAGMKRAMEEEERKSRAMAEGFEAIMQYSVRGADGFGGGQ